LISVGTDYSVRYRWWLGGLCGGFLRKTMGGGGRRDRRLLEGAEEVVVVLGLGVVGLSLVNLPNIILIIR
jgi:hypothetical protein